MFYLEIPGTYFNRIVFLSSGFSKIPKLNSLLLLDPFFQQNKKQIMSKTTLGEEGFTIHQSRLNTFGALVILYPNLVSEKKSVSSFASYF